MNIPEKSHSRGSEQRVRLHIGGPGGSRSSRFGPCVYTALFFYGQEKNKKQEHGKIKIKIVCVLNFFIFIFLPPTGFEPWYHPLHPIYVPPTGFEP